MNMLKTILVLACVCLAYASKAIIYRRDAQLSNLVDLAKDPQFNCIGLIYDVSGDTNQVVGSCVLINDKYILTAWHVFNYGVDVEASTYKIVYNDLQYSIDRYLPFPEKGHDIVLVELKEKVENVPWAALNTSDQIIGDTITLVGYGTQRPSDKLDGGIGIGVRTAAQNIIDSSGGIQIGGRPSRMYAEFNDSVSDTSILLPLEGMINGGDSGGGMFLLHNGNYVLAGIASGMHIKFNSKTGFDGSSMYWCNVAAYHQWIAEAIGADMH